MDLPEWLEKIIIGVLVIAGMMIIGSIIRAFETTCPECGTTGGGKKIGSTRIPGSDFTRREPYDRYTEHYVMDRVRYRCKRCGYEWEKEEEERVG